MPKVRINQFNGGLDEDVRSHNTTTFKDVKGFDTLTYKHRLTPYGEAESEALSSGSITDKLITDVVRDSVGYLAFMGRNSSGSPSVNDLLLKDNATNVASTITAVASDSPGAAYLPNSLVFYRSSYYYIQSGGSGNVRRIVSGTWATSTIGSVDYTSSWSGMPVPRPIIHPMDDILYGGLGQNLFKINNTTYSDITTVSIPTTHYLTSFTDYDAYLAIAAAPAYEGGNSRVYLWNRDTSLSTFTSNIDWGNDALLILENLGGTLVGVSTNETTYSPQDSYDLSKTKKITVRVLSGGQAIVVKEIVVPSTFSLKNYKAKSTDRFYFGGDNGDALYVVKKNSDGTITVSKDRFVNNGSAYTTLKGLNIFGDYLWTMFDTASTSGNVLRTKVTSSYTNTSAWETNINPSMPLDDRMKLKSLKMVAVGTAPMPANGSVTVSYSVDGGAYETLFTETTDSRIATHTNSDSSGNPLKDGYEYQFKVESTGGAEITELRYDYDVIDQNL